MVNGLETEIQHNNKIRLIRIKIRELIVNRNPFHNLNTSWKFILNSAVYRKASSLRLVCSLISAPRTLQHTCKHERIFLGVNVGRLQFVDSSNLFFLFDR